MRFPPEVVSLIVEQVRLAIRSDREALGHPRIGGAVSASTLACALVSRDWADGSIPHLYYPNLELDFSYANYQSLVVALERNAWCLPLVRRVEARLLDGQEAESQWVSRRCEARDGELRAQWEAERRWPGRKPYHQWLEYEVREEWMIAEDEGSPETLWCTTVQGVKDECAAFYALLGLFPNLEHLGVTDFPHGPSRPLALVAASPTDAVLANLKSLAIIGRPVTLDYDNTEGKPWEQLLAATPAIETLVLPDCDNPEWTDRHPPQLPLLRHLTINSFTQPIIDLLTRSSAKLETLIFRNSFNGRREPAASLAAALYWQPSLHTLELPTRQPLDIFGPWPKETSSLHRMGGLSGLNWRAEDQSNRRTWDDRPFDGRILVALRDSSLRHFIINEPLSRKLVQFLPPTLETLEYRIRTREPDDLDTMTDWVLKRQMPKLRRIAYRTSKETWTRFGPGMAQEYSSTAPHGGVDDEQRRADARVARAASAGIVLEVPGI